MGRDIFGRSRYYCQTSPCRCNDFLSLSQRDLEKLGDDDFDGRNLLESQYHSMTCQAKSEYQLTCANCGHDASTHSRQPLLSSKSKSCSSTSSGAPIQPNIATDAMKNEESSNANQDEDDDDDDDDVDKNDFYDDFDGAASSDAASPPSRMLALALSLAETDTSDTTSLRPFHPPPLLPKDNLGFGVAAHPPEDQVQGQVPTTTTTTTAEKQGGRRAEPTGQGPAQDGLGQVFGESSKIPSGSLGQQGEILSGIAAASASSVGSGTLVEVGEPCMYKALQSVCIRKVGADPTTNVIAKCTRKAGCELRCTGKVWRGPSGGLWAELDAEVEAKPGWVLIQGLGFGVEGPLLERVLKVDNTRDDAHDASSSAA